MRNYIKIYLIEKKKETEIATRVTWTRLCRITTKCKTNA